MKNKYFITGVMGFVGSHWAKDLLEKGNQVIGIDISDNNEELKKYDNFTFYKDTIINNKSKIESLIKESDIVLHLASIAEPAQYMTNPKKIITIAALASIDIIDLCEKYKKNFLHLHLRGIWKK